MHVTKQDHENERRVANLVKKYVDHFSDIEFAQNTDPASPFDFLGYHAGVLLLTAEVKVRDIASNQYPDFFISKEKFEEVCQSQSNLAHYIFYWFKKDRVLAIYDLRHSRLKPKQLSFKHKRSGENLEQLVYCVPSDSAIIKLQF